MNDSGSPPRGGRPRIYTKECDSALYQIWEVMSYPCGEILNPMIETYRDAFIEENEWNYTDETNSLLIQMSLGTVKNRIAGWREKENTTRGRSSTVPSPLKDSIPIRKSHTWVGLPPGHVQTDTVVHCGDYLTGDVVYSLGIVDFATYWSEYTAQWNKGEVATRESLERILERTPFPLKELHPDTGSEFINYHVQRWTQQQGIEMTRSEPYKKNDNMCIEERNDTISRTHLGYARMDSKDYVSLAQDILHTASLLHNHFRPVRRMKSKTRVGSKWKRVYEKVAVTPYERVLKHKEVSDVDKKKLQTEHESLKVLQLERELVRLKQQLRDKLNKKVSLGF